MSFTRRVYKLVFDGVYEGLEVRAKGASIGEYVETKAITSLGPQLFDTEHEAERVRLVDILVGKLTGWNLTDEETGEAVPCTAEQLAKEDLAMLLDITKGWMEAGFALPAPLAQASASGVPSEAPDVPMEAL